MGGEYGGVRQKAQEKSDTDMEESQKKWLREWEKKWKNSGLLRIIGTSKRVFFTLAAVVVFVTTYALILPAISMDGNKAGKLPGIRLSGLSGDLGEARHEGDEEVPVREYEEELGEFQVLVGAPEDAFPKDAEMRLEEGDVEKDLEQAVLAAVLQATGADAGDVWLAQAMDISFWAEEEEIEPAEEVSVAIRSEAFKDMISPVLVHVLRAEADADGNFEVEVLAPVEGEMPEGGEGQEDMAGLAFYRPLTEEPILVSAEDLGKLLAERTEEEEEEEADGEAEESAAGGAAEAAEAAQAPSQDPQGGAQGAASQDAAAGGTAALPGRAAEDEGQGGAEQQGGARQDAKAQAEDAGRQDKEPQGTEEPDAGEPDAVQEDADAASKDSKASQEEGENGTVPAAGSEAGSIADGGGNTGSGSSEAGGEAGRGADSGETGGETDSPSPSAGSGVNPGAETGTGRETGKDADTDADTDTGAEAKGSGGKGGISDAAGNSENTGTASGKDRNENGQTTSDPEGGKDAGTKQGAGSESASTAGGGKGGTAGASADGDNGSESEKNISSGKSTDPDKNTETGSGSGTGGRSGADSGKDDGAGSASDSGKANSGEAQGSGKKSEDASQGKGAETEKGGSADTGKGSGNAAGADADSGSKAGADAQGDAKDAAGTGEGDSSEGKGGKASGSGEAKESSTAGGGSADSGKDSTGSSKDSASSGGRSGADSGTGKNEGGGTASGTAVGGSTDRDGTADRAADKSEKSDAGSNGGKEEKQDTASGKEAGKDTATGKNGDAGASNAEGTGSENKAISRGRGARFRASSFSLYILVETGMDDEEIEDAEDRDGGNGAEEAGEKPYTLTAEGSSYYVQLQYTDDAEIPEGAGLSLIEIPVESALYQAFYAEAEAGLAAAEDEADADEPQAFLSSASFFDIGILDGDGQEVEPQDAVELRIIYKDPAAMPQDGERLDAAFFGSGQMELLDSEILPLSELAEKPEEGEGQAGDDAGMPKATASDLPRELAGDGEALVFEADGLSVFGLIGTESLKTRVISHDGGTYEISVQYDQTAGIPEGAVLDAYEIPEGSAEYDDYLAEAAGVLGEDGAGQFIHYARIFEIDILADGEKVQPQTPVTVHIALADAEELEAENYNLAAVHFGETAELIGVDLLEQNGRTEGVSFLADSFSVFTITGTSGTQTVEDGDTVKITKGATVTITAGGLPGTYAGTTPTYSWSIQSGSAYVELAASSTKTVTVTAISKGTAVIKLKYTYYYQNKNKTDDKEYKYTIIVEDAGDSGGVTEEEATAEPGNDVEGLTVSVKDTGNVKKLSGYQVKVADADGGYENDEGFLKAYHIYLMDDSGREVDASALKNNGDNVNLQVTMIYNTLPDWFSEAAKNGQNGKNAVKHYKDSASKESQDISGIAFDSTNKTIRFNVHGFSDFVFVKNTDSTGTGGGTSGSSGGGGKFLLSKTAAATETENEYEITLQVQPQITWGKKKTSVNYGGLDEIFEASGVWLVNSHNSADSGVKNENSDITDATNYDQIKKVLGISGNANGGRIMASSEDAKKTSSNSNTEYKITKLSIGSETVSLTTPYYVWLTTDSQITCLWVFPNGNYLKLSASINGGGNGNGNNGNGKKNNDNGNSSDGSTLEFSGNNVKSLFQTYAEEYVYEDDIGIFSNSGISIAEPRSVSDPMGKYIKFLNFTGIDGVSGTVGNGNAKSISSSYSSATETDGTENTSGRNANYVADTIKWEFSSGIARGNLSNTSSKYTTWTDSSTGKIYYYLTSPCYELKYKIRLDVQGEGFQSTNPLDTGKGETRYETNGTTTLTYDGGTQTFEIPQVAGILYDLKIKKVDDAGKPVSGAEFALFGTGNGGAIEYGSSTAEDGTTTYGKTATSDSNGIAAFTGLPWGTYTVKEIRAPDGYALDASASSGETFTLCYTDTEARGKLATSTAGADNGGGGTRLMYKDGGKDSGNDYSVQFTNHKIQVDLTVDKKGADGKEIKDAVFSLITKAGSAASGAAVGEGDGATESPGVTLGTYTKRLEWGKTYIFQETTPPAGYLKAEDVTAYIGKSDGVTGVYLNGSFFPATPSDGTAGLYTCSYTITDPIASLPVRIVKVNQTGIQIAGADITLKKANTDASANGGGETNVLTDVLTEAERLAIKSDGAVTLSAGTLTLDTLYTIEETAAPDGYNKLPSPVSFKLVMDSSATGGYRLQDASGNNWEDSSGNGVLHYEVTEIEGVKTLVLKLENTTGYELPSTGGGGTFPYTLGGLALLAAAALMYGFKRRAVKGG